MNPGDIGFSFSQVFVGKKITLSSTTLPFGTVWSNYSVHMYLVIN